MTSVATAQQGDALDGLYRSMMERQFPGQTMLNNCLATYLDPLGPPDRNTLAAYLGNPDFDPAAEPPQPILDIFSQLPPQDAYYEACRDAVDSMNPLPDVVRSQPEGDAFDRVFRSMLEEGYPGQTELADCMMTAFDVLSESQREILVAYASDPDFDPGAQPPESVLDISGAMPPQDAYLAACREAVGGSGEMPDPAAFVPGRGAAWPPDGETVGLVAVDREGSIEHFLMATMGMELRALSRARSIDIEFRLRAQGSPLDARGFVSTQMAQPDGRTLGQLRPMASFNFNWTPDANYPTHSFGANDFTAIAQFAFEPTTVHVAVDSPLTDIAHLVSALRENPGLYSISCGGPCSGGWDVPFVQMLMAEGVDVSDLRLVSNRSFGEGINALLNGEVDVYLGSIRTAGMLPEPDRIRAIAVMSDTPVPLDPEAKLVGEWLGTSYVGGMWYGIAAGPGMDPALVEQIAENVRIVTEHGNYRSQMAAAGISVEFLGPTEFTRRFERHFEDAAATFDAIHAP